MEQPTSVTLYDAQGREKHTAGIEPARLAPVEGAVDTSGSALVQLVGPDGEIKKELSVG